MYFNIFIENFFETEFMIKLYKDILNSIIEMNPTTIVKLL